MRIGIDLGGTKIEAIVLGQQGEIAFRKRVATPQNNYQDLLYAIQNLIYDCESAVENNCSVGIGIPGSLHPDSARVRNANLQILNGQTFAVDLEVLLNRPIRVSNDANCFALSEACDGAAKGAQVVFGVILGTGCGGGLVFHGKVWQGASGLAGEWGHNPLPAMDESDHPGVRCYCGRQACIETFVSGTGLARDYKLHTGHALTAKQITAAAEAGEAQSQDAMMRLERRLAKALAAIINVLDPDCIVLGGGLSNCQRLYRNIPLLWSEYIFGGESKTKLMPAIHGDSSGVRGAAWLWPADGDLHPPQDADASSFNVCQQESDDSLT
ncbi:MAG: ROK family protein [Oligoflexus sp.]